jgi:hypothetical protein
VGNPRLTPTFVNPCTGLTRTGNFWFNPGTVTCTGFPSSSAAIANPALRTYGSLPRNAFRGPGRTNLDLAVGKMTPIFREKLNMEFRAEFFNIFNHTQFANPSTNISSSLFGQITTTFEPRIIQFAVRFVF